MPSSSAITSGEFYTKAVVFLRMVPSAQIAPPSSRPALPGISGTPVLSASQTELVLFAKSPFRLLRMRICSNFPVPCLLWTRHREVYSYSQMSQGDRYVLNAFLHKNKRSSLLYQIRAPSPIERCRVVAANTNGRIGPSRK